MTSRLSPIVHYVIGTTQENKTRFDFTFPVLKTDDVKIVLGDGQEMSRYTVTIDKYNNGGYVEFPNGFSAGTHLAIYREMVYSRQTQFRENEDFHASVINEEFDRMVMLLQQAGKSSKDSLRQAKHDIPMDMTLPSVENRADKILGFDSSGRPHVLFDPSESAKDAKESEIMSQKNAEITARNLQIIEQKVKEFKPSQYAQHNGSNIDISAYKAKLSLGDASHKNVGINPDEIPVLDTDGKLPSSVYNSGGLPTKSYANKSVTFFIRNSDGSLPIGILSYKVWSLSEQKLSFGGTIPTNKRSIELPAGLNRFKLAGGGGGGSSKQGHVASTAGGSTQFVYGGVRYTADGAQGGRLTAPYVGAIHINTPAGGTGDSSTIIHYGKGGCAGDGSIANSWGDTSIIDGSNGGMIEFVLDMKAGDLISTRVGAGGAGSGHREPHVSNSAGGADGYIEVEYE